MTVQVTTERAALLAKAADLLRNSPAAWETANQEQRNDLAKLVFQSAEIKNDHVSAITPKPDFAPFFALGNGEHRTDWASLR